MKKKLLITFLSISFTIFAQKAPNPIIRDIYTADPSAHVWADGRLYLYPSHDIDPPAGCDRMDKYHVYSTDDMINWTDHGQIVAASQVPWGVPITNASTNAAFMWAPDCAYRNGKYYFYFPHPYGPTWNDTWRVGIAVSDHPASDFTILEQPLQGTEVSWVENGNTVTATGLIDPCIFTDDDGQVYFYFGGGNHCFGGKMKENMIEIDGQLQPMTGLYDFHEGTWVFKRNGMYYLTYADNKSGANQLRYATSDNPLGPWSHKGVYLNSTTCDTSHGSVIEYKDQWWAFYHIADLSGMGNLRSVCVDSLFFDGNGGIKTVVQTKDQGSPYENITRTAPGTIEAEDYNAGGQGIAYWDNSANNTGGYYRLNEAVDIKRNFRPLIYYVSETVQGEYINYSFEVLEEGDYNIDFLIGAAKEGETVKFYLEFDYKITSNPRRYDVTYSPPTDLGTVTVPNIHLTKERHTMTFRPTGSLNFDKFTFKLATQNTQSNERFFSPKGVAEVRITLDNGKQIGDIKNEKHDQDYVGKLDGTMVIRNSERSTYGDSVCYSGKIQIEGRGNTTWGVPKKPYNIDLLDNEGGENPQSLLDMPESDEWALLAFWHDRSLMRIPLAMYLGRQMSGIPWTPHIQYVELWINDEYIGLYCLSDKVQRGDTRVDLKKLTDSAEDQSEPRISGGYLLEGSSEEKLNEQEKAVQFRTSRDINFTFKYPKAKNVTASQREWIKNYLNEFESVLWGNNYKDPDVGYQKYIETESFIDWTILHEQSKGPDNLFHASTFVSKDRNGKLNMNAPWDFDLSYANGSDRNEAGNMVRTHRWFARLQDDPAYFAQYASRFDELRPLFLTIPQILEDNYQFLAADGVLDREKEKWPQILKEYGPESNQTRPLDYHAHVRYLSDWIQSRDAWCYIELGKTDQGKADRLKQTKPIIRIFDFEAMEDLKPFYVKVMQSDANSYRYYWNDDASSVSNNFKKIETAGKYWVKIVDNQGNISLASDTLYFGVPSNTAIKVANNSFSLIYNNPARDFLDLKINLNTDSQTKIQIIDLGGRVLISKKIATKTGENFIQLPVASLNSGIYILQLSAENGIISKKIIVEKH